MNYKLIIFVALAVLFFALAVFSVYKEAYYGGGVMGVLFVAASISAYGHYERGKAMKRKERKD